MTIKKSIYSMSIIFFLLLVLFASFFLCGCNKKQSWTITQYGRPDGGQYMFYTIVDQANNLIIIDGGHDSETEVADVLDVISKHNNHVSAWIITHMHPDHVGAFNNIVANHNDITIDNIYTIDVHDERYRETAKDYDVIGAYDQFLNVIKLIDSEKIHYVYENDTFSCSGMDFTVLHTWDDSTDKLENNLMNNGSMAFIAKGKKESMLFLADVENETEDELLQRHSDVIEAADYIQLGHHGNWGMTLDFYSHTSPKGVFFDAANFLFEPSDRNFDAPELKEYFENNSVKTNIFKDAPNQITIE